MSLTKLFGGEAPHKHTHTYTDRPNASWIAQEKVRLIGLAEELGIEIEITQANAHELQFGFSGHLDSARFRVAAFGSTRNPEAHVHAEAFSPGDERYQDAWLESAQRVLNELGVGCRIVRDGEQTEFRFDTVEEHAVFVELRDRGVFHDMAMGTADPRLLDLPRPELN